MTEIVLRTEGDVGLLEIDNPPENYLEQPDFIELEKLQNFVSTGIKALVISGVGRNFSAGASIKSIQNQVKNFNVFKDKLFLGNQILNYIDELNIPVIAAISGVCFGAGFEIALACDIRISDKTALFAFPEINHDLFPGMGGIRRLGELTGKSIAMELVFEGDFINAEKAIEIKAVDVLVEKNQSLNYSVEFANRITSNRPLKVINAIMQSIHNSKVLNIDEMVKTDAMMFSDLALDSMRDNEKQ